MVWRPSPRLYFLLKDKKESFVSLLGQIISYNSSNIVVKYAPSTDVKAHFIITNSV